MLPHFHSTSLAQPHTKLSTLVSPSLPYPLRPSAIRPMSRFLSCVSNPLYFCYAGRRPPLSRPTNLCHKLNSLFIAHSSPLFCFLPSRLCSFPQKALTLLEHFSPSNSLNFDTSSQVVDKNGESKSGSLPSNIIIDVAVPPWTVHRLIPVWSFAWSVS